MNEHYPDRVISIPSATPDNKDAAQYLIRHGRKQFNLCGELCVAYITQDETGNDDIDKFLNYWQATDLNWYQQVFRNGLARTTGIYDLEKILVLYGYSVPLLRFEKTQIIPLAVQINLSSSQAILGVQIDHTGYLVGRGIAHWVVLENIFVIDNNHAICDIYNPFTNAMEPYSWRELMTSTGAYKQGIWVQRA